MKAQALKYLRFLVEKLEVLLLSGIFVVLLVLAFRPQKQIGRFVAIDGTSGLELLLDTSTGQVCYTGGTGVRPGNQHIPACLDLAKK